MTSSPESAVAVAVELDGERLVAKVDGVEAWLRFRRDGERMVITHTSVPEAIGGRGIAGQLTQAAFEHARAEGWKVQPDCEYAAGWAERHPEYRTLLV